MSKTPASTLKLDGNGAWWCDPQDYSGFGLKSQTPTPKSAQLASRALARAAPARNRDEHRLCPGTSGIRARLSRHMRLMGIRGAASAGSKRAVCAWFAARENTPAHRLATVAPAMALVALMTSRCGVFCWMIRSLS